MYSNVHSGVVRQALAWANGLRQIGVTVDFPQATESYDWGGCDIVHLFQYGSWAEGIISNLTRDRKRVILSPIVDRPTPYGIRGRMVARIPFERAGLEQRQRTLYRHGRSCACVLARSELEARSLGSLGLSRSKIEVVRLGVEVSSEDLIQPPRKSMHVFHMSQLDHARKNVRALVVACRKAKLPLKLAGKISDPGFAEWLAGECEVDPNLSYLGILTEEQKWKEMCSASIFCLPSLNEGVGLVALEAYLAGAHVVMTKRSGGTEYFNGDVEICDPVAVDDIADCILRAAAKPPSPGPRLDHLTTMSFERSSSDLRALYARVIGR